ncbi:MAG: hypothetical protein V4580_12610 [Bacteroidota bacterium]
MKYKNLIANLYSTVKALFLLFIISSYSSNAFAQEIHARENELAKDTIIKFDPDSASGFYYAYFIRLPKGTKVNAPQFLLVETNNSGANDSLAFHERETYLEVIKNSLGSSLCKNLKVPFLVPVFPRPKKDWKYYTHALDRDVALIKDGSMKRLDEQLIAMTKHAKLQLQKMGILINEKIMLNGFSASGSFANRFTFLHPELVAAVACGGINAIPMLPVKTLESSKLIYPIGIYDYQKLFSDTVHLTAYKKVPQFIYMGGKDENDAVLFDDAYSDKERAIIYKCLGKTMQPDRWIKCQDIYKKELVNATFKTYGNIGHQTDKEVFVDVSAFFSRTMQVSR